MTWQRRFHLVRMHLDAGEALPTEAGEVVRQGEDLGQWVTSVRLGWGQLTGVQQWMCEQVLGIEPATEDEKPKPRRTQADKWAMHYEAARQFYEREGHLRVPRKHVETIVGSEDGQEGQYRLGAWVSNQRSRAAMLSPERVEQLSKIGMVWSLADERFQENLEAAKAYYDQHWTLCAPRTATALDKPVGQWLSNLRRPGALDGHPEWESALREVDPDWNPAWPADWQRHYAALRELLRDEAGPTELQPGITVHGMDIGKWLARQRAPKVWDDLAEEQRERLEQLGITPLTPAPETETPAKPATTPLGAFERGVAALAQYKTRTGSVTVPRGHVEALPDGSEVKLGVWIMNQKTRRTKLGDDKLTALTDLGLDWARA
ncbi:helicase associated domain-containing protein [Streptomyces sp. NPDC056721]|uniref:helicase associated domain-containing protein n=1 Tax=Streptomyces sp. NPDC056721 TaxID=3345923 RepID=UPI00367CB7B7